MGQAVADNASRERARKRSLRRVFKLVAVVLVPLVLVTGAAGAVFVSQYEPLTISSGSGVSGPTRRWIHLGSRTVYVPEHREGETFLAFVPLQNDGPLAVEVRSVFEPRGRVPADYPMTARASLYAPDEHHPQDFMPMNEGVVIEPGENANFAVEYVFGSCKFYEKGGSEVTHGTLVTYSVFGLEKTIAIDYGFDIVLKSRGGGDC